MPGSGPTDPAVIDTALQILTWCAIGFAALWLVATVVGFQQRRAYNLTRAESGRSKRITPDFLKVDRARRQAAIDKGKAYDAVLDAREAPAAVTATEGVGLWSRLAAMTTATLAVVAAIVGTLTKIGSIQEGIDTMGSWDRFSALVAQHKVGAVVAVAVIGANLVIYVKALKSKSSDED